MDEQNWRGHALVLTQAMDSNQDDALHHDVIDRSQHPWDLRLFWSATGTDYEYSKLLEVLTDDQDWI